MNPAAGIARLTTVPGFISAFAFGAGGAARPLKEGEVERELGVPAQWLWLHLNLADRRCERWLGQILKIPAGACASFTSASSRQHIEQSGEFLLGHIAGLRRELEGDSTEFAWLHFVLAPHLMVTGRVHAVQSADRLRLLLARGEVFPTPEALLVRLVGVYPDTLEQILHRLTDELEVVEDHVLDDRHRGERRRLMVVRREVAHLHRHMRGLRRAINQAERLHENFPKGLVQSAQRLANVEMEFDALEARARFFHDEIDAKLTAETNRQLYILSALTAAFLPPALIAGLFGMNVGGIPWANSSVGFWLVVVVGIVSSSLVILYLHLTTQR